MSWHNSLANDLQWSSEISNKDAKQQVANRMAERVKDGDVIGVGSGSTAFLAIQSIARKIKDQQLSVQAIPTSHEVALTCSILGIPTTSLASAKPDWAFDGADEVDPHHHLIKGRGGAMFHEKLVIASSSETYILVDESKFVDVLGSKHPVPLEVDPRAIHLVETRLEELPIKSVSLRMAQSKDGPVLTEAGNVILDVHFTTIAPDLESTLSKLPGMIESGLFQQYKVNILS
ncbi:ribose 5-phosphate isomerase [Pontibacillus chungwhensis BH030062]|uniref:Ribose 5-phosphate isomerase A n=1 Tax=Pontibacillus chungwhensis BH030062 TaxID=1385513 RepID=A0A0A2V076_9BACI|nr:ribose 5-phosphate isomerase A [Pontibacillus chungwhensis]KGP92216.1 ribose 5-phosphate isomerase [Pontibacillus chungwhensis BH030062]